MKKEYSERQKIKMIGKGNPRYGVKVSEETKQKMRDAKLKTKMARENKSGET